MSYSIKSSTWDSNGAHHVTIATPWPRTAKTERRARDLARRSVSMPEKVQWSRLDSVDPVLDAGRVVMHFTVSRLDRMYR